MPLTLLRYCLLAATAVIAAADCTVYSLVKDGTCAEDCLNKTVGVCPVSLVAKLGHLHANQSCSSQGYTEPNGTKSQKAGPCGTLVFKLYTKSSVTARAAPITLAAFDGSAPDLSWKVVDDPVMGGQSRSQLIMDPPNKVARWFGQVKVVPFLKKPGFCTFRSNEANFPDVSGTGGLRLQIRNNFTGIGGLSRFAVQLETKGGRSGFKQGTYSGNFTVPASASLSPQFIPWDDFVLTWRGEKISGPKLRSQLDQIKTIGLSTFFPGAAGKFDLEVQSMSAV